MNQAQAEVRTAADVLNEEEPTVFRELHETFAYRLLTEPPLAEAVQKRIDQIDFCVVCDKGMQNIGGCWLVLEAILLYLKAHRTLPNADGLFQFVEQDKRAAELTTRAEEIRYTWQQLMDEPPSLTLYPEINGLIDTFIDDCGKKRVEAICQKMLFVSTNGPSFAKGDKGGKHDYGWQKALVRGSEMIEITQARLDGVEAAMINEIPPFPANCIGGKVAEIADSMQVSLGWAFPALLPIFGTCGLKGCVDIGENVRGTAFTALLGPSRWGKSLTWKRGLQAVFVPESAVVKATAGSDIGLLEALGTSGTPMLLVANEMRDMMSKAGIKNSSLPYKLSELWEDDHASNQTKGVVECMCRLNLLGGLKCDDPSEFAEAFPSGTNHGFFQRMYFGVGEKTRYVPLRLQRDLIEPVPCLVPGWCFGTANEWEQEKEDDRAGLAELALRAALIVSCVNGDAEVRKSTMDGMLDFMAWQQAVRAYYEPSSAVNQEGQATQDVMRALSQQKRAKWSTLYKNGHWDRYGSPMMNRIRDGLVRNGIIGYEDGMAWLISG
jgi:hypothetical protein